MGIDINCKGGGRLEFPEMVSILSHAVTFLGVWNKGRQDLFCAFATRAKSLTPQFGMGLGISGWGGGVPFVADLLKQTLTYFIWITVMSLPLDRWPLATRFYLRATWFAILLAHTNHPNL